MEDYRVGLLERIENDTEYLEGDEAAVNYSGSDLASDLPLREIRQLVHDQSTQQLDQIERALQRMEDGTYGSCAHCGESIPLPRLRIKPFAMLCVNCQFRHETK